MARRRRGRTAIKPKMREEAEDDEGEDGTRVRVLSGG